MLITRKSVWSGKERTIDLPVTAEQLIDYQSGTLIQNAFLHLTRDQREFFLSGMTDDEWQEMAAESDDGEDCEDEAAF